MRTRNNTSYLRDRIGQWKTIDDEATSTKPKQTWKVDKALKNLEKATETMKIEQETKTYLLSKIQAIESEILKEETRNLQGLQEAINASTKKPETNKEI